MYFLDSCCINDEEVIQAYDHKQEGVLYDTRFLPLLGS